MSRLQNDSGESISPLHVLIRQHRLAAGLTQEQLAEKIGATLASVSEWESGALPSPKFFPPLARVFKIKPLELTRAVGLDLKAK